MKARRKELRLIAPVIIAFFLAMPARADSLARAYRTLAAHQYVDLTHTFGPQTPVWSGFGQAKMSPATNPETGEPYTITKDGFHTTFYQMVGQYGTHVDPPAHFAENAMTMDKISLKEMILPLVCVDVHEECEKNPDYTLTVDRLEKWEADHGTIPVGAFVAMRTDWSKRWPDAARMANKDKQGIAHYPGWSLPALKYLYEERKITASGHETTDTDPGLATTKDDYSLEAYILGINHYQIELLTNLDQVPESGAIVVVSFPKPKGGSGFPARVFAILP